MRECAFNILKTTPSQKFKYAQKYDNEVGRTNIWNNLTVNIKNVKEMKHNRYTTMVISLQFISK